MKWTARGQLICILAGTLAVMLLWPNVSAGGAKVRKYRYSDVDIPVSLAVGTVRTPEFDVKPEAYFIMILVEKRLPFQDLRQMMGLKNGTSDFKEFKGEPLLQAEWTVWDGGRIVSQGSSSGWGDAMYADEYLLKFVGQFMGESKKKFVVEMKFTKDASPLNVTNPHLIVITVRNH